MRYTLMHISDIHTGRPFLAHVAEALVRQAHVLKPDLLVVSGDLVQRAIFPGQWRAALALLAELPQPQLVIAGNHDVPIINPLRRLFTPMYYYKRYARRELNPVFTLPGLTVVGGNTAHGLTIDGGFVGPRQRAKIERAFAASQPDDWRIAVLHHPLRDPPGSKRGSGVINSGPLVAMLERCGVQLVLGGHIHFLFTAVLQGKEFLPPEEGNQQGGLVLCQSGTTTSRRGRGSGRGQNSFNVIELDDQHAHVVPYIYETAVRQFVPGSARRFLRQPQSAAQAHEIEQV